VTVWFERTFEAAEEKSAARQSTPTIDRIVLRERIRLKKNERGREKRRKTSKGGK
jgi:hypothetical protein